VSGWAWFLLGVGAGWASLVAVTTVYLWLYGRRWGGRS
jgi:hypothetical protein